MKKALTAVLFWLVPAFALAGSSVTTPGAWATLNTYKGVKADGTAIARTVAGKLSDMPRSVKDYGAVCDGVADDSDGVEAALAANRIVTIPAPANCRLTRTLVLTQYGAALVAAGSPVSLTIDHLAGSGVVLTNGAQSLRGMTIFASATRRAAATDRAQMGVRIGGAEAGTNYLTGILVADVVVRYHPGIGIYMGAEGSGTMFERVSSDYNQHHGWAFDDGTIGASSPTRRSGIVTINAGRAQENGGNGLNLCESGSSCYRFTVNQFETIANTWNAAGIAGLRDAQGVIKGQNVVLNQSGWDDSLFAGTTTAGGSPRLAKGAAGDGLQVMSGTTESIAVSNRFLTVTRNIFFRTGVAGFVVDDAYANPGKNIGFRVESGVSALTIRLSDLASYTTPVYSDTAGLRASFAGVPVVIGTATGTFFKVEGAASATIASNAINATAGTVYLSGEGGAADDLQAVNMAGGAVKVPEGVVVRLVNKNAYAITIKHGLTNIYTKSGADVVLGTNQARQFVSDGASLFEL